MGTGNIEWSGAQPVGPVRGRPGSDAANGPEISNGRDKAAPNRLTRRRKAAMVVQMLLAEGKKVSLAHLPEEIQLNLTRELASLRIVDRETMHAVAQEFSNILDDVGIANSGGIDGAIEALSDQISPEAAAQLKSEESTRRIAQDPWAQITSLPPEKLKPIIETESIEVSAVVLSKLPVVKAADLLGLIAGERARRVTCAMSQTGGILPDVVARIGGALATAHCTAPVPAFAGDVEKRLGAILDSSGAITRDSILEGLGEQDPAFAEQVRRAIFTFKDIPQRVAPRDISVVVRGVDGETIITALTVALAMGGAEADTAEFILTNISQRMSDQLREDISERGTVRARDGEAAMKEVVKSVKDAAERGELTFVEPEEDDEEPESAA